MYIKHKKAFSLIELSLVILILATLIAGSIGASKSFLDNSKVGITKNKIDSVYKALGNFVATYKRLPCPANLAVAKGDSTYGNEASTPGNCATTNLSYGMVPVKALGLDEDMAEDGWGTKFSYVVDKRFTRANTGNKDIENGFEVTKATVNDNNFTTDFGLIDIQSPASNSLFPNKNVLFVLISHGANKSSGFSAIGTSQNAASGIADEDNNGYATSYDRVFVSSSTNNAFDDIILFKTKLQLLNDAELEYVMCSVNELVTIGTPSPDNPINTITSGAGYSWSPTNTSGEYGCYICSTNQIGNSYSKASCGKYGIWNLNTNFSNLSNCKSTCL